MSNQSLAALICITLGAIILCAVFLIGTSEPTVLTIGEPCYLGPVAEPLDTFMIPDSHTLQFQILQETFDDQEATHHSAR